MCVGTNIIYCVRVGCCSEVTYIEVVETQETIYDIYYELTEAGEYDMDIKFGGKKIPNGAFTIKVQRV